jgi:autotransporter-associated beta strand protein
MPCSHDAALHRQAPPRGRDHSRGPQRAWLATPAAITALTLTLLVAVDTFAATYTYTIASSVTRNWSTGLSWSPGVPVSGSATSLVFSGSLGNGTVNTSNNDLGIFQLSSLSISATGPNTGASSFTIAGDPLQFLANSGSAPSIISVVSGSTLPAILISNNIQLNGDLTVDISPSIGVVTVTGTISGADTLTKTGAGKLVLSADTANNTFTGDTRIVSGDIELGNVQSLVGSTLDMQTADSGSVTFGIPGTTTYNFGGLKGSRGIDNVGNTLSIGGNGKSTSYSGAISGTGGFVKTGTGALTLAGTSTYSGPTTVTSGSLILDGRLANSNAAVQSGALLGGTGSIGGDLTVGGTLSPGSPPGSVGSLTVSGSVTLQNGATTRLEVTGSTTFDEIIGTGAAFTNDGALVLSIDAPGALANYTLFGLIHGFAEPHLGSFDTVALLASGTYAGLNNTVMTTGTLYGPNVWMSDWVNSDGNGQNGQRFLFDQSTGTLALVPEPTTWALAAIAAGMLGAARLRLRRSARKTAG